MKNKKRLSSFISYLIVILLVLITLCLVYVFLESLFKPEFKITKEECRNETGNLCEMNQKEYMNKFCKGCNESFKSEEVLLLCVEERHECEELFYNLYCKEVILDIQSCEQKEVEEIIIISK